MTRGEFAAAWKAAHDAGSEEFAAFRQNIKATIEGGISRGGPWCCGTTGIWHQPWCPFGPHQPEESP